MRRIFPLSGRDRRSELNNKGRFGGEVLEDRRLLAVVISEFMADNESGIVDVDGDFSDWIEIRNTGPQVEDLAGWYLSDDARNVNKWQFPSVSLDSGEHLLVFASGKDRREPADQLHTNFKLSNDGEYLALFESDGSIASEFAPEYPSQIDDVSYGLSSDLTTVGYFSESTPGQLNVLPPIADASQSIVINELMYSLPREGILDAENIGEEFIELHNRGSRSVDLNGWSFTRGVDFTFSNVAIPANGFLVIAADVATFQAKYPSVTNVVGGWLGQLANNGETIELSNANGVQVDSVRYASQGDWAVRTVGPDDRGHRGWMWDAGHDGGGKSIELINPSMSNNVGQNWTASSAINGTPGAVNSARSSNIAPLISDVIHTPAIPRSDDDVIVTAKIVDERLGARANLNWRVAGSDNFISVAMVDLGDGTRSATIPAMADRSIVEFYVSATDTQQAVRTWPAPTSDGQQVVNALYQVLDDFDQDAEWDPTSTPVYFQIMTPVEREEFTNINRQSDAQFNATFIAVDGTGVDIVYNAGIRIRGSASRSNQIPNNRISIPNDRPWNGVTRVNMNAANPANQVAGAALFRLAGVETADARAVRMFSNGIDLKNGGYYAHVEVLDGEYAANHFPHDPDGTVYRGRRNDESPPGGQSAGLVYNGPDPLPYVSYVKNTNSSQADWSDVINLTNVLNNAPDASFVQDVQQVANVEQWFRAFAMNSLLSNNEFGLFTGDRRGDDYAMYVGLEDPRFLMLPYDLDSMFTDVNFAIDRPQNVPALNRLIEHPEFRQQYYGQFLELTENILLAEEANEVIDNSIGSFASQNRIDQIKDFLRRRAANIQAQIFQSITVQTNGDDSGQYPRLSNSNLQLSGAAPTAFTRSVTVNGIEVDSLAANRDWTLSASSVNVETNTLIPTGATWRYLDDGSDQGTAWRLPGFDDSDWSAGPAELGYGDGDEATTIDDGPGDDRAATSYFRSKFEVESVDDISSLQLLMNYDDGAAVYINGTEVTRVNLADDAAFDTFADGSRRPENVFDNFNVAASALVNGTNTIAVEVHQHEPDSSDVSFDLELVAVVETDDGEADLALRMFPGLNRYTVKAFDGGAGTGQEIASEVIDVWYDTPTSLISGTISSSTTWTAEAGPYEISGNVTIADGVTLSIEPGTSVFFRNNARLTINGRLSAFGLPHAEIRFTRLPGTNGSWNGLQFRGSMNGSRIEHAVIEYGVTSDGMIGLENSELTLNHVTLDHTDRRRIRSINSSLVVRNSVFENIFDPGEAPTTDNQSEHIWGRGIPSGGQWILDGNVFGHITGHNDSVDFDAPSLPAPLAMITNNLFMGGGDDALDMTGDVWIEGNTFQNFIKDEFNTDPGESNTISASGGTFWVIRNVFDNVQHASLVKEEAFMHFLNNTVSSASFAPLYFDLPGQTSGPGRGAFVQNSIFDDVPLTFDYVQVDTDLVVEHSFLPAVDAELGGLGNQFGDPHIGGREQGYKLLQGSRAENAGAHGQDLGAKVLSGAFVSGEPVGITSDRSATLSVGGPLITHYRFRLDGGAFSSERPVTQPIVLSNLADGDHVVEVIGRNELGVWQLESDANASRTWTVDRSAPASVRINEILASQSTISIGEEFPDLIELHNPTAKPIDISGYSLTDDPGVEDKFVFPQGTVLVAGEYRTVVAGESDIPVLQTGFGLSERGDGLFLYNSGANRNLVDSVVFGLQLEDLSLGRLGDEATWGLAIPSFGAANTAHPVNDGTQVQINEWYASGDIRIEKDYVELYNPGNFPAAIGQYYLSDKPFAIPTKSPIRPLSFVAAGGFVSLIADGAPEDGADHLAFRLSPGLEQIGLFDPELTPIDFVFSYPQTSEISQGRVPNGSTSFEFLTIPTPGATNGSESQSLEFGFSWNADWLYDRSGEDLSTAWREVDYDDSQWSSGAGPLGNEREALTHPIQTEFELTGTTYYFRKRFHINDEIDLSQAITSISTQVDDGFVVYLNGVEVARQGMPDGEVPFDEFANRNVNEAQVEGPFGLPNNLLRHGENVFAAEVHQFSAASGDLVFGLEFGASVPISNGSNLDDLVAGLRISELMYDNNVTGPLDYIELQNTLDVPLNVSGIRLSGVDFVFPDIVISAGDRVVVAEDASAFLNHYGQNLHVVGQYSGELSDTGERIALVLPSPFDAAILRFDYDSAWYPATAGNGRSLEVVDPGVSYRTWSESTTWQASEQLGGSPGFHENSPQAPSVVINEVLAHTDLPLVDTIELFNRSTTSINVGGWYLSDSANSPKKFQIPDGVSIPAGAYMLFDENDFNSSLGADPADFGLSSSKGETLWLWQATNGQLDQVIDSVQFGASANGETIGRTPNGVGRFYPMAENTLGSSNSAPRVGPVVISEINYHPQDPNVAALAIDPNMVDDDLEFLEIYNSTESSVDLTNWRIRDGVEFDFSSGTVLPASQAIVVTSFDPSVQTTKLAAFRAHYGIGAEVRIIGGYTGKLDNGDDKIQLQRPDSPPAENPTFVPRLLEDEVQYDDDTPWPVSADGAGDSLTRMSPLSFGSDAESWSAATPTPGRIEGISLAGDLNNDRIVDVFDIDLLCSAVRLGNEESRFDLNGDFMVNVGDMFHLVEQIIGTSIGDANLDGTFNSTDFVAIFQAGEYEDNAAENSTWAEGDWNCDADFTTQDLVVAFQRGTYSTNAIAHSPAILGSPMTLPDFEDFGTDSPSVHLDAAQNQRVPIELDRRRGLKETLPIRVSVVESIFAEQARSDETNPSGSDDADEMFILSS